MLATWQLCACSRLLRMLVDVEPKPQFYLAHTYSFHALHFYSTLAENTCNPSWTLLYILRKGISVRLGQLKIAAQFIGAFLATLLFSGVWVAEISGSPSQTEDCSGRIQTTISKAFLAELVVSAMVQLSVMHTQSRDFRVRVNALAATVTALAYAGGHLTGAIFNPALAFSLHLSCFLEKFWNYTLVYWVAPCIGSVLVAILWDDVIPPIRSYFNV
ncbi:aquaporin-11 isoform X2 [Heteronotia binoei]|uniref:aquaporin-11 isoform X2 n=1 Tax=Heteronotia binoei TaxID=13085 RepID=UPI00292ECFFC|nr:aquaporin-11 isoform X2 [Heteronotia binoei]